MIYFYFFLVNFLDIFDAHESAQELFGFPTEKVKGFGIKVDALTFTFNPLVLP